MDADNRSDVAIAVVICTRNRGDKIGAAVESVLANRHPSFNLTIIDQSTDDLTRQAVDVVAARDDRVRYVHSDVAGLSRAYNQGIRSTTAPIIAFTDDDCLVPEDWLEHIAAAFDEQSDGELLYGKVIAAGDTPTDEELTPYLLIEEPERLSKTDGFRVFGMGANFAARRRLFDRVGYFDEKLGGGGPLWSSQDFDLTFRAYRAGSVTLLRPEVVLRHDGRRESDDWPSLLLAYGSGDGAFYMKHVRCGDVRAAWLLSSRFVGGWSKHVVKRALRRDDNHRFYLKGLVRGSRASFKYGVDRGARLYVER